jgi:putative flavoprotein involved in K+ transport
MRGRTARFGDRLEADAADADRRMRELLDSIDWYIDRAGLTREVLAPVRPTEVRTSAAPSRVDLRAAGIGTVLLATGYRPDNGWIELPIVEADGTIRQDRGVTEAPGVYVVGQRFQHRRDSGFIGGARHDAYAVVQHLTAGTLPTAQDRRAARTGEEPA